MHDRAPQFAGQVERQLRVLEVDQCRLPPYLPAWNGILERTIKSLRWELPLLQQIYRNPARKARLLAQAAENRSGAYAVYVSTGSAGSHSQRPRSPGVAAVGKFAAVVLLDHSRVATVEQLQW
jgi:hypothetical protein